MSKKSEAAAAKKLAAEQAAAKKLAAEQAAASASVAGTAPVETAPVAPTEPVAGVPTATVAEVKPPKAPKDEQNGITKPGAGTTTRRIWEIADTISATLKAPAPRADVMKQAEAEKINQATAATQYGKWRKYYGLKAEVKAPKVPAVAAVAPAAEPAPVATPAAS